MTDPTAPIPTPGPVTQQTAKADPDPVVPLVPQPGPHRPIHFYRPLRQSDGTLAANSIVNLYNPGTTDLYTGPIFTNQGMTYQANNPYPCVTGIIDIWFASEATIDVKVTKADETTYVFPGVQITGDADFSGIETDITTEAGRAAASETQIEADIVTAVNAEAMRAAGVEATIIAAYNQLQSAVASLQQAASGPQATTGIPTGGIMAFPASAPVGFLYCDGSTVSRSTYQALFAAIGTMYGAGDGSTTFGLPDMRGAFIRGAVTPGSLGTVSTGDTHSHATSSHILTDAELPQHTHGYGVPNHTHDMNGHSHTVTLPDHMHNITVGATNGATPGIHFGSDGSGAGAGGGHIADVGTRSVGADGPLPTNQSSAPSQSEIGGYNPNTTQGPNPGADSANTDGGSGLSGSGHDHGNTAAASVLNPAHIQMNFAIKT